MTTSSAGVRLPLNRSALSIRFAINPLPSVPLSSIQGLTELPVSEELTSLGFRFTESIGGDQQHIARHHFHLPNLIRLETNSREHSKWKTRQGNFVQPSRPGAQHERERKPGIRKTNCGILVVHTDNCRRGVDSFRKKSLQSGIHLGEQLSRTFRARA